MTDDHIEYEVSSGNVFEDVGFDRATAARLTYKSELVGMLHRAQRDRGLNQISFGKLVGIPQPRLSQLFSGKIDGVSVDKLLDAVARLGGHVTIRVDAYPEPVAVGVIELEFTDTQDNHSLPPMAA